jgi:hypothetical protein
MYYTIALLRYTSIEVLEVGGVADSLVWPTRLYGRLACMADSLVKHVKRKASHKAGQDPTKPRCGVAARSQHDAAHAPPSPPRKTTRTLLRQPPKDYYK